MPFVNNKNHNCFIIVLCTYVTMYYNNLKNIFRKNSAKYSMVDYWKLQSCVKKLTKDLLNLLNVVT